MVKLVGKLKAFSIRTWRACKGCGERVESVSSGKVRCPNCGLMSWKRSKRVWFTRATFDIFDTDIQALLTEKSIGMLLTQAGLYWRRYMDRLKGLRLQAWFETYKSIKREIEDAVEANLIGKVITFYGKSIDENTFLVKKVGESSETSRIPQIGAKFVEGNLKELDAITENVLSEYKREIEWWEDNPVLNFKRDIQGISIEIGLRAPLQEYGKAYRVWMRANGTHMYPSKPVRVGKNRLEWVLRIYHTKGWNEKLRETLTYCMMLEAQLIKVVKAAKELPVSEVKKIIQEFSADVQEEILDRWHGGTLWNLVEIAGKIDRAVGISILKKFKLLPDADREPST